jgi:hypothetical protein
VLERYWKESGMMYLNFAFLFASNLLDWYFLTKEYLCDKIKKNEMGGEYNIWGR